MKLGDRVTSKKTGLPGIGILVGIMRSYIYVKTQQKKIYFTWDELYPNWKDGCVAYVEMDQPQKSVSFMEYKRSTMLASLQNDTPIPSDVDLQILYKYIVPVKYLVFPLDDLELIEEFSEKEG